MSIILVFVLFLILVAEFVNGWTDSPNAIATVVSTRVLSPLKALVLATLFNVVGTMTGIAVATTIGKGIVDQSIISVHTIAAAMLSIIVWSTFAARFGIPTSESHALIAGLTGAALAGAGPSALLWEGWQKVLIGLVISTFIGFTIGFIIAKIIQKFFTSANPVKAQYFFSLLQVLSAGFMALNHGMNDGQKFIGVFALALVLGRVLPNFEIPLWVILLCALTMGIGTSFGGWRIIRRIGMQMVELVPWQGFSAEMGASLAILGASSLGIPLSTTHTIATSIMGVAASRRMSAVRWGIAQEIVLAWILTFPICGILSFITALFLKVLF